MGVNRPPVELENGVAPTLLLWVEDVDGVNYTGYSLSATVRQNGSDVAFPGSVTYNSTATADRDQASDIPTFTVAATAALTSLSLGVATVIVSASAGGKCTGRHHFPAKVIG